MSRKLTVGANLAVRLAAFLRSDLFAIRSAVAKTEYWKGHADLLQANVDTDTVSITGDSGFYVPQNASITKRVGRRLVRAIQKPHKIIDWAADRLGSHFRVPRMMSYEKAFDAAMSHAIISDPDLSPSRINHITLARNPNVLGNAASVRRHYQSWSGYQASASIFIHYYYQNILRSFVNQDSVRTVLEIGAGNGNFPSIFYHDWSPVRVILVDLPETLAVAIPFLSNLYPEARLVMPNELSDQLPDNFDFAFLTVDQLDVVGDDVVDLAINCHSFQEMTHDQIDIYFKFVQRVCRESGLFFCANRVEKIPCGPDAYTVEQPDPPNLFAEYPWNPRNKVLVYEISRLSRLANLDGVSIRLEQIRKS